MVDRFLEAGGTYFDTAHVYIGSEEAAKKALVFAGSFALGAVVAVAGREADAVFLLGVLIVTDVCFAWLLRKHQCE